MKLAAFVMGLVEPLLGKILISLGFSIVSYVGFVAAVDGLKSDVVGRVSGLPPDMLNVFLLCGGGIGISVVFAAVGVRVLLWQAQNARKILGSSQG